MYEIFSDFYACKLGYSLQNIHWGGLNEVREIAIMRVPSLFLFPLSHYTFHSAAFGDRQLYCSRYFPLRFYQNYKCILGALHNFCIFGANALLKEVISKSSFLGSRIEIFFFKLNEHVQYKCGYGQEQDEKEREEKSRKRMRRRCVI